MTLRAIVDQIETNSSVPAGEGDRFAGYTVVGIPFRSGHVLALRRFPASSVGPGFTSVWHRDPRGVWTFYSTVRPDLGCARYFGGEVTHNVVGPIGIEWTGPNQFIVNIGHDGKVLRWEVVLSTSLSTRIMNAVARLVPDAWWHRRFMLKIMGIATRWALGTGKLNLTGKTPNGHQFIANAQHVWLIDSSHAILNGLDLGPTGPLIRQARLNEFLIPQRGLFAVGSAFQQAPRQVSSMLPARGTVKVD